MNLWPPFLLTGIHIEEVADDFRHVRVRLSRTPLTTNYVGTDGVLVARVRTQLNVRRAPSDAARPTADG